MDDPTLWGWASLLSVYLGAMIWPLRCLILAFMEGRVKGLVINLAILLCINAGFCAALLYLNRPAPPPKTYTYCPKGTRPGTVPECTSYHF